MAYTGSKAGNALKTVVSIGPVVGTATPTYVAIGEVRKSSMNGAEYKTADTSNFQSTAEEFIGTIPGTGMVDLEGNYISNDPGQIALDAASRTGEIYLFQVQFAPNAADGQTTTGDLVAFNALVYPLNMDIDVEKGRTFTCKLKISNFWTVTKGS